MRWHYRDPPLVWSFVGAYAAHLAEELFGGFPTWFAQIAGPVLPTSAFLVINGVALPAMAAAAWAATRVDRFGWLAISIATVAFVNGAAHLLGSLATGSYSPGLITGAILYLPLGQLALLRAWHQVEPGLFARGVLTGVAAHTVVTLTALVSAR